MGPATLFTEYELLIANGEAEAVPDLGEAAVYDPGFRALVVDAGEGQWFAPGINGGYQELAEPRDALVMLATSVLERF